MPAVQPRLDNEMRSRLILTDRCRHQLKPLLREWLFRGEKEAAGACESFHSPTNTSRHRMASTSWISMRSWDTVYSALEEIARQRCA